MKIESVDHQKIASRYQSSLEKPDSEAPSLQEGTGRRPDAFLAVELSLISYEGDEAKRLEVLSRYNATAISSFSDDKQSNANGYACIIEKQAWIFFRGTDDNNDCVSNLQFRSRQGVHGGFLKEWEKLKIQADQWLLENSAGYDAITTTGHSLGGAIAVLCARDLLETYPNKLACTITFGAPPVFYHAAAKDFRSKKIALEFRCIRVVNANDMATWLPCIVGLEHVGETRLIGGGLLWIRLLSFARLVDNKLGKMIP